MSATILTILLLLAPIQASSKISASQKQEFLDLLTTLPTRGEFYTDDAVKKAGPYLPVLLSLTEKDVEGYDIYRLTAISRGLCNVEDHRKYASDHFSEIKHPQLKLLWAAMLFVADVPSPEIRNFLRIALASKSQSQLLSDMLGPSFESFRNRVLSK